MFLYLKVFVISMEPITMKTVKLLAGSSVGLSIVSIVGTVGLLFLVLIALNMQTVGTLAAWFALTVLGIATYYFAFGVLSWGFLKAKQGKTAKVAVGNKA